MSFQQDGSTGVHRAADSLANALKAQLALLDGFFPLQGWMVAYRRQGDFCVLAVQGCWQRAEDPSVVGDFMHGNWTSFGEHPGFQYRKLNDSEKSRLDELLVCASVPSCIIRRPLRDTDGHIRAWLIGASCPDTVAKLSEPGFPIDYMTQAVISMALSLSLYADLEAVHRELTELQKNAFIEPLTGVLNRAGWINRVQHLEAIVARSGEDVAIVMLDLDLLKLVNDLDGHSAGDELLQLTAQTIRSVVRRSDVVGRLGGDEFGVAIRGVNGPLAQGLVGRLRAALDDVGVNVSIGMALKSASGTLDDTYIAADRRMYEEKRAKPMSDRAMQWRRGAVSANPDSSLPA